MNVALFLIGFALLAGWVMVTYDYDPPDDPQQRLKDWMDERRRDKEN